MASSRALLIASITLAVGGFLLLGWLGWVMLNPGPPLYRYQLLTEGGVDSFPDLDLEEQSGLSIRKYALRITDSDQPLVIFHVGERENGDSGVVLLDWQNQIDEALITITPPIAELPALTAAVSDHVSEGAVVLGWYTVERREGTSVRVYFLTDAPSSKTLIAQALPFTSSQPSRLEDMKVVYQHGGYWVYKIQSKNSGDNT